MALAPTLYDFQLQLSDSDRGVDVQRALKVARHPSETMERLWLRLLAYCWLYEEGLSFAGAICEPEEPDLKAEDPTGRVSLWVRVGKSEPAKIRRAVTQNGGAKVAVLFESAERLEAFLASSREEKVIHLERAELAAVDAALLRSLGQKDARRMKVSVTIAGDHFYVEVDGESLDGPLTRAGAG